MHHPFTFFERYLSFVTHDNLHIMSTLFIFGLLVAAAALIIYPKWKKVSENIIPEKTFNVRTFFELIIEMIASFCDDVIGPQGRLYLPFAGTLFIFLFCLNLLGLIPGFLPPTEMWVTGTSLAMITFIAFNYYGFKAQGWAYLKHFMAPVQVAGIKSPVAKIFIFLALFAFQLLFISVELISTSIRPVTLAMRLTVNMTADHLVLGTFSTLVPYVIPIIFMLFGIFVSFVQAFIFTILTMVYISMAVAHDH